MICFPNAKINLGLNIVSKRPDGYHNLETVFYPIGLKDALEIVPSESNEPYRFFQTGIEIKGNADDNLVIKALKLILQEKEISPIDIHLLKKIPFGAGLGGGSSDAAFMLKLLNNNFGLGYSDADLMRFAAKLGADCAFFIKNKPAFASGIGDELEEIELDLSDYFFVLVKPDIFVPTIDAYSMVSPKQPEISLKKIIKKPVSEWKEVMKNDFEPSVFKKYFEICKIKEQLYDRGAVYASMSGSGSSVYAFFEKETDIRFDNCFVWKNKEI
ncbi:MAG: 4-diphosphocytidyl-2-C-methyl-D-erythritol kinase [Bacteroidetes bacterium ADurb.BinA174]|jgi:4-diphosphocytidyl-2-C-methyl-D-erythritol kinase|nr:MAG: 4-diphosphocytidyl-2-C-methyl-D-erythritol kinase [Bacteroidetes bacterium ADurb.BinA174]